MNQRTVKSSIDVVGVGLHTGRRIRLEIHPAPAGAGIRFERSDRRDAVLALGSLLDQQGEAAARLSRADHATTLAGDGFSISTVEHLMAALRGLGVDNAVVRLSGDEVPIMDGSAAPFVFLLKEAGLKDLGVPRRSIVLNRPIGVVDGDREVTLYPADHFRITYTIDFPHAAIGRQTISRTVDERTFVNQLAPARTFCLLKDVQALRARGLALGGSLLNAVVVGDAGPLNPLRFQDEFVRHKALDLIGDLALLGYPLAGHVVAYKAGHEMHARLLRKMLEARDAWTVVTPVPAHAEAPGRRQVALAAAGDARRAVSV
ncbi:MAG TPA: UDP-3-O-acyl-N-acetylglucosamine deacetylase [Candidatus Polarisedimenticolia bacterium]|nr:UDP-3-O-acyl-N-acetylglucosamine deacetylase [Candidatus Polarisedimenticolia bacterium]